MSVINPAEHVAALAGIPVRWSRIFPYRSLDADGTERTVHGAVVDGVLVCSRECLDALKTMAEAATRGEKGGE